MTETIKTKCLSMDAKRNPETVTHTTVSRYNEKLEQLTPEQKKLFEEFARYESEHITRNMADSFEHLKYMHLRKCPRKIGEKSNMRFGK